MYTLWNKGDNVKREYLNYLPQSCLLGIMALFLAGCGNKINFDLDQNGKIILRPQNGDHVKWAGTQVGFLGASPCKGVAPLALTSDCDVDLRSVASGRFTYLCPKNVCPDPDWVVGPSNPLEGEKKAAKDPAAPDRVALVCSNSAISVSPANLPDGVFYTQVSRGDIVLWITPGNAPLADWTITFTSANGNPCLESSIGYPAQNGVSQFCTINKPDANPFKYQVKSMSCNTPGTGSITVTQ
jgi:hypothetical protein